MHEFTGALPPLQGKPFTRGHHFLSEQRSALAYSFFKGAFPQEVAAKIFVAMHFGDSVTWGGVMYTAAVVPLAHAVATCTSVVHGCRGHGIRVGRQLATRSEVEGAVEWGDVAQQLERGGSVRDVQADLKKKTGLLIDLQAIRYRRQRTQQEDIHKLLGWHKACQSALSYGDTAFRIQMAKDMKDTDRIVLAKFVVGTQADGLGENLYLYKPPGVIKWLEVPEAALVAATDATVGGACFGCRLAFVLQLYCMFVVFPRHVFVCINIARLY